MANITQQQLQKINNMCSNEWMLDLQYLIYHKEKTLIKRIRLDEEHYLEYRLGYNSQNLIYLHISKFYHKPEDTFASTSRYGEK